MLKLGVDALPLARDLRWFVDLTGHTLARALYPVYDRQVSGASAGLIEQRSDTEWTVTPGQLLWSDGVKLSSAHVVDGFRAALAHPSLRFLADLGLDESSGAKVQVKEEGEAVGVRFPVPVPHFPVVAKQHYLSPYRCGAVSLGPYRKVTTSQLLRNPHHGEERHPSEVRLVCEPAPATMMDLFESGGVDATYTTGWDSKILPEVTRHPAHKQWKMPIRGVLMFGCKSGSLMAKRAVRQGISQSIDRNELAWSTGGLAEPTGALGDGGFDVGLVGAALSQVQQPLIYADFPPNREVVETVVNQWNRTFGVKIETRALPFREHALAVARGNCALSYVLVVGNHPTSLLDLAPWTSHARFAPSVISDRERLTDHFHNLSRRYRDQELPESEINSVLQQELPFIPLVQVVGHMLANQLAATLPFDPLTGVSLSAPVKP